MTFVSAKDHEIWLQDHSDCARPLLSFACLENRLRVTINPRIKLSM